MFIYSHKMYIHTYKMYIKFIHVYIRWNVSEVITALITMSHQEKYRAGNFPQRDSFLHHRIDICTSN